MNEITDIDFYTETSGSLDEVFPLVSTEPATKESGLEPVEVELLDDPFILEEKDPKERVKRWGMRRKAAVERERIRYAYYMLYLLTYDGKGHEYSVESAQCDINPVSGADWVFDVTRAFINRFLPIMEEIASELNMKTALLRCIPRSYGLDDIKSSDLGSRVLRWMEDRSDMKAAKLAQSHITPLLGSCFARALWDDKAQSTKKTGDGNTLEGPFGEDSFKVIKPWCLHAPDGYEIINDMPWLIEDELVPWSWIAERHPEAAKLIPPVGDGDWGEDDDIFRTFSDYGLENRFIELGLGDSVLSEDGLPTKPLKGTPFLGGGNGQQGGQGGGKDYDAAMYRLCRCWERHSTTVRSVDPVTLEVEERPLSYWQQTLICHGIELESKPFVAMAEDPKTGEKTWYKGGPDGVPKAFRLPYVMWKFLEIPGQFWGRSITASALDPIRVLAILDSLAAKLVIDQTNTYVMYQEGNSIDTEPTAIGTIIRYFTQPPVFERPRNALPDILPMIEYYERQLEKVTMRPAILRGYAPDRASGDAIAQLTAEARGAWDNIRSRNYQAWSALYMIALEQYRWNMSYERLIHGIGQNDITGVKYFKGADLSGVLDVVPVMDNVMVGTRQERIATAKELVLFGVDQQDIQDFILGRVSEDVMNLVSLADNRAQYMIEKIMALPEQGESDPMQGINTVGAQDILEEMQAAVELAKVPQPEEDGPTTAQIRAREARNTVLKNHGIGVEDFEFKARQARRFGHWLNSDAYLYAPEANRVLICERWRALMDKDTIIPMAIEADATMSPQDLGQAGAMLGGSNNNPQGIPA